MKLIAAPGRQFRTWSMWLLILAGIFDLAVILAATLTDLHVMSGQTLAAINAVLAFLTGAARLVHQQISATTQQKADLIRSAAGQPVREGQADVGATPTLR